MKKIVFVLIAVALATPVFAQEEPPPIVEASHNAVVAFLNLTPEQAEDWFPADSSGMRIASKSR